MSGSNNGLTRQSTESNEALPRVRKLVGRCLEQTLDDLTDLAHLISRSMGGDLVIPRIFTFLSDDADTWRVGGVEPAIIELLPDGMESVKKRLTEGSEVSKYVVRVWLYVMAPQSNRKHTASGKYILIAGSQDGETLSMAFARDGWSHAPDLLDMLELFDEFKAMLQARVAEDTDEEEGLDDDDPSPTLGNLSEVFYMALQSVDQQDEKAMQDVARTLVEVTDRLYGRYVRSLLVQTNNMVAVMSADREKEAKKSVEPVERNLKITSKANSKLKKDYEKIESLNSTLLQQRNALASEVKALKVTSGQGNAVSPNMEGKGLAERLDLLF